jgi:hypothetical protein
LGGRTIENFGLVTWSGGNLAAAAGCAISNRPGGIFQFTTYTTLAGSGTPPPVFHNEGLLVNTSVIGTNVLGLLLTNSGIVRLHSGLLACNAGFAPAANSTLQIPLGGPTPGVDFGELLVSGNVVLAGTLEISLTNVYLPDNNTVFSLLIYGSKSGAFSAILLPPPTCDLYVTAQVETTAATVTALLPGPCLALTSGSSPGSLQLDWSGAYSDLKLQTTDDLVNGPWVDVPLPPGSHSLTVLPQNQQSFYRLVPP